MKRETVEEYIARGGKVDRLPPATDHPDWASNRTPKQIIEIGARIPREFDIHHQRAKREEEAT